MSLSSYTRIVFLTILLLSSSSLLGACSVQPVYSGRLASQPLLNLAFDKPGSRLEQIIYHELSLRFGSSTLETVPRARVTASTSASAIGYSVTGNPSKARRITVSATLTLSWHDKAEESQNFTRQATAEYTINSQVLADTAAYNAAMERAAKSAAESLRLAVLAALSRR